ncbi:MAG: MEDS domain-containing protein [Myxococcota bacterium]
MKPIQTGRGQVRHGLSVYRTPAHLAAGVAAFATRALHAGAPVVLVPSRAHRAAVLAGVEGMGIDVAAGLADARLLVLDADEVAAACIAEGDVAGAWTAFERHLDALRSRGARRVAVWGEGTDLLLKAGRRDLSARLERRWCEATATDTALDLACSFCADLLDEASWGAELAGACALHTDVTDVEDAERIEALVDRAVAVVLGPRVTGMAWSFADARPPDPGALPVALARLLWLREQMPATCSRVLAVARGLAGA